MEQKTASSPAERAALYNTLRAAGANPDEAAQGAGWKNFNSAQNSCSKYGIKISAKGPPLKAVATCKDVEDAPPEPVIVPDTPTPALIPDRMALEDKPRALRPCCWYGKDFQYTDTGDCITITPLNGKGLQLSYEALKQFSEEINELLEIIK